ncbi:MAG: response regulator [Deltaproteobacteria bacterium]|nr:response regulator [Deltaproteobacteria bacterium]
MDADALLRDLLRGFSTEAQGLCQRITKALLKVEGAAQGSEALRAGLDELARALHNLKGSAATIGLHDVAQLAHQLEDQLAPFKSELRPMPAATVDAYLKSLDGILEILKVRLQGNAAAALPNLASVLGDQEQGATRPAAPPSPPPTLRQPEPEQEQDGWRIGSEQIGVVLTQVERLREVRLHLEERHRELARIIATASRQGAAGAELRASLLVADRALQVDAAETAEVVEALEEGAKAICTTPVETVLAPLQRLVRDLARQLGKEAKLSTVGGEIALDRRVVEALKGPLVQLLRNALDHGLERPQERERAGKHRVGALVVRVELVGNLVFLEVSDDGSGLDLERIRATAATEGLLSAEKLATAGAAELHQLVFHSGFSTRKEVTGTSGRGVGLDVVRAELARLQGQIEVQSTPGQGTRFTLSFPAKTGNSPLLLVRVAEHVVGMPMHAVHGVVAARAEKLRFGRSGTQLVHEGQLLDVLDLGGRLGIRADLPPTEGQPLVLLCAQGQALAVDEVMGERELAVRPLPEELRSLEAYQGLTQLARGELAVVLRPAWLASGAAARVEAAASARAVLVVDDSLTTRAIHRTVLESGGFVVHTAASAAQAFEQLQRTEYAALVCDISLGEGLDGFALTSTLRTKPAMRHLPVVLVSSHDTAEDRRRGTEAGADAFLSKKECAAGRLLAEVMQVMARRGGAA